MKRFIFYIEEKIRKEFDRNFELYISRKKRSSFCF